MILMKKKMLALLLLLTFLAAGFGFTSQMYGDVSKVQRNMGQSEIYSEKDIQDAMEVTEAYFRKNFAGCQLLELTYDAKYRPEEMEWEETYGVDQVILLTSSFYVKPNGGDGSLNPDDTYYGWKWILARNEQGKWEHRDHGYG